MSNIIIKMFQRIFTANKKILTINFRCYINKILNSKLYATEDLTLSSQLFENFLLFSFAKDHVFEVQHICTNPE